MSDQNFIFLLTKLQIRHFQSHLSHVNLFFNPESTRFYILVDNKPWVGNNVQGQHRWLAFIQTPPLENSVNPGNNGLLRNISGFIVLQVLWNDLRGLNYLNQLQTDTSLALEARSMIRWDFDNMSEAEVSLSSWFDGTQEEKNIIKKFLQVPISIPSADPLGEGSIIGDSVCPDNSSVSESSSVGHSPPAGYPTEEPQTPLLTRNVTRTSNVFMSTNFDDRDLPFILKEKIISNPWLLILLESGLPSWFIFLQSHPGFRHLCFPWMCLLVRMVLVMISFVTFLIGFYDFYKNIPVHKTVYWIIAPLLDWVETLGMMLRIRYLGTLLFLQNFQIAFRWSLMMTRTSRSFVFLYTQPIARQLWEYIGFQLPAWVISNWLQLIRFFATLFQNNGIESSFSIPILWIRGKIDTLYLLLLNVVGYVAPFPTVVFEYFTQVWVSSATNANELGTGQASMLQILWNEMLPQIFDAVRRIVTGFFAFSAPIRSIYNHARRGKQLSRHQASQSTASEHISLTSSTASEHSDPSDRTNEETAET